MLFATNRVLREGPTPRDTRSNSRRFELPREVNFDLNNNQPEQSIYFCRRRAKDEYTEIGREAFFSELKDSPANQILFYLHGYNSLPEPSIFPTAEDLQSLFNEKNTTAPGNSVSVIVVPLIWPCDNDIGLVLDYFDDQDAADDSDTAFARLLKMFVDWRVNNSNLNKPCTKRINILTHSMGNRVLARAYSHYVSRFQSGGVPLLFRNIFMAAADLLNESLEPEEEAGFVPESARNIVVYYASDDLALRASKIANIGAEVSRRLGHTGPENLDLTPKNVYAVDCDDFNTDYDPPFGHGYFRRSPDGQPGLLFNHLWECIKVGRVPMDESGLRSRILSPDN